MQSIEKNKSKHTVMLISPPLYFSVGKPRALDVSVPPLGILYLASYINKNSKDFNAVVMDVATENISLRDIGERIKQIKPFVVGISSMTPQLQGCIELARFLKKNIKSGLRIFLGGPHISADRDFINRFRDIFDYAITGEAEETFLASINNLLRTKEIPTLQSGEPIMNLDIIPFPDRRLIHRKKYSKYESMIFSRGCPYQCYYCSRPSISQRVRFRSTENLISEIKYVNEFCRGRIDFQDDTFTIDKLRVMDLCRAISDSNLKLEWRCNTRIDLVDEELLLSMKKAGCSLIHFGIESGNEKVRREIINKGGFSNKSIHEVFKACKKLKIRVAGYFMIGNPGETNEDILDTKEMILNSGIDLMGLSIPTPFPGSRLYEIAKEKGIIDNNIIDRFATKKLGQGYAGNYPIFISDKVTKEDLFVFMKEINRKFYINFRIIWKRLKDDIASFRKIKEDAKDLFYLLSKGISSRKPYLNKT